MYLGKNVLGGRLDNGDRSMRGASVTVENVRGHLLFIVVQLLSCVELFETPWTAAHQASLSLSTSWSLLKLMSTESVMPSNRLIFCHLFLLWPWIFPSTKVFSSESALRARCPKHWSFSFSISPSNEYSRLFSYRIDCFDLFAVQGTLKSLLQRTVIHSLNCKSGHSRLYMLMYLIFTIILKNVKKCCHYATL